jgi:predicted ferric reductase
MDSYTSLPHLHHPTHLLSQRSTLPIQEHGPLPTSTEKHIGPRNAVPWDGVVKDFGVIMNTSSPAVEYTHGLLGVSQFANYALTNALIISFMGLLLITFFYRCYQAGHSHFRRILTLGKWVDQRYWMLNHSGFWPKMKKHFIYAPLFRQRHNREIQLSQAVAIGTLPSRYHTLLLFLYLASNLAYTLGLNWSATPSYAVVAELRGRSGQLAAINLIPTILFALRNNPFLWILGVSYDTFNLLHRWCARVVIVESLVHTACWASNGIHSGGWEQLRLSLETSTSYRWGFVASCAMVAIFFLAIGPLRHAFYETFLNLHRMLAMLALAGVWIHIEKANLPQMPYLRLCLLLWVGEIFWRTFRIAYHNFSMMNGFTQITVEALPAEACRVTFDLRRPWNWTPGCHVHAYLPAISLWSSHPFSVAWAENRTRRATLDFEMQEKMAFEPPPTTPVKGKNGLSTVTESSPDTPPKPDTTTLALSEGRTSVSLVMRARTGMTRKLYDRAAASPTGMLTTWGAIEGPYGGHDAMTSYGTVILFAGGVGITHCVGYVHHLMLNYQAGTSSTQKILLVWSVPNTEALEWVRTWMDTILKMEGRRDVLRIQLFVTKPRHRGDVVSNTGSVLMFPGRCNAKTIIQKEFQERIGAMGVTVCGPGAFSDSVRAAVRTVVTDGSVDFVEEAFTY